MTTQMNHILTVADSVDLDAAIAALAAFDIRVVCVDATVERVSQLTVRPSVEIDLPVIEYVLRRVGIELLDLRTPALCGV